MLSIISSVIFSHDVLRRLIIIELSFLSRRANHSRASDDDPVRIGAFFLTLYLVQGFQWSNCLLECQKDCSVHCWSGRDIPPSLQTCSAHIPVLSTVWHWATLQRSLHGMGVLTNDGTEERGCKFTRTSPCPGQQIGTPSQPGWSH